MVPWWWLLLAGLLVGPVWVVVALWMSRRTWRSVRRLSARAKGHKSLVELTHLAGGLAHEIKNPLSTINMNLRLLIEDLEHHQDEEHSRWLRRLKNVHTEAGRLRAILDDFLRYAGKVELHPFKQDLRTLVDELTDFFAPQADAASVVMRTSLPATPVICNIDVNLIKQAILNLMINAVQAMDKGGELIISVGIQKHKGFVAVTDTGPGIPSEDLPNIFRAYYSTKSGGSGLGLPTTQRIIREHDGTLKVDSEPGKGTRFTMLLPLYKE